MPDKKLNKKEENKTKTHFGAQIVISDDESNETKTIKIRFEALFEMTNDAIFWIDAESERFILINKKATELLGYSLEELYSKKVRELFAKSENNDITSKFSELKSGKKLPIYENIFQKKSGELIHTEINLSIFDDPTTTKKIIQSSIRDVTQRKLAEKELELEREILQNLAVTAIPKQDIAEYTAEVLKNLLEKLHFDFGSLILHNEEEKTFDRIATAGSLVTKEGDKFSISTEEPDNFVNYVVKHKEPIFAEDIFTIQTLKQFWSKFESYNIRSLISYPIFDKRCRIHLSKS